MADIELVIKIPDKLYETIISDEYGVHQGRIYDIIRSGTPLPKGHGRLMILSEDKLKENQINLDFSCQKWISKVGLSNATVAIIEADKEYEAEIITRGNCMICGKKLDEDEDLFFCKECEAKAERKEV